MTEYDWYVFFLCLVVFAVLTALFAVLITSVVKLTVRLIRSGAEDKAIREEQMKEQQKSKKTTIADRIVSIFLETVMIVFLCFLLLVNLGAIASVTNIPTFRAVQSGSMAEKNPANTYLYENNLNNQLQTFDLVLTRPLPEEFELELYDIVVYEVEGTQIIHRIVGIEEPNEQHPGERIFTLQGDAVENPDFFAVKYAQMKGIYRGERIPFVGSFVMFMQSPAGWLCILLIVLALVASPVVERRIIREKKQRLELIEAENDETPGNSGEKVQTGDSL